MTTLYITEPGTTLRKTGERLIVARDGQTLHDIPLIHVAQVVVVGRGIEVTTEAMLTLVEHNIDLSFFTRGLRFRARVGGEMSGFGQLRLMQIRYVDDATRALDVARVIVAGKLTNQRRLLMRMMGENAPPVAGIGRVISTLPAARDPDTLRGYEGQGAAVYFDGLRTLIPNIGEWGFERRLYHPPPDPINAMLSYAYSLLTRDVLAAVYRVGLDPYIGIFHALHYNRPSLALDLVEEFRPLVADMVVLGLLRGGHVSPSDFSRADGVQDVESGEVKERVLMAAGARTTLLAAYEARLAERITYGAQGNRQTYRQTILLQAQQMARLFLGEADGYLPVVLP